jgi:hypothetical protein
MAAGDNLKNVIFLQLIRRSIETPRAQILRFLSEFLPLLHPNGRPMF